jgi:molybdopterin molybdotransferase
MLPVSEALALVLQHARPLPPQSVALGPECSGRILAESVVGDLDSPPYDKALMDGYAVRGADCAALPTTLKVIEEVGAGRVPSKSVGPREATRIMTGAPIPAGANCVVRVEQTDRRGGEVTINAPPPKPGQHILPRGRELRAGDVVLPAGTVLHPQELGILAGAGRASALLYLNPRLAILSTGDEVVEPPALPGPGQIRNSNGPMLLAQALRAGAAPRYLGIARDDPQSLRSCITAGLTDTDVLILSGGVSAGTFDLVPGVLQELGVAQHFHKVAMKPGKPLFFGTRDGQLVFGLPGNPVSSFVCFELFIRPAVRAMCGESQPQPRQAALPIAEDFRADNDRPTYHPARLEVGEWGVRMRPLAWFGSADLRGIAGANALIVLPPGAQSFHVGDVVPVVLLEM